MDEVFNDWSKDWPDLPQLGPAGQAFLSLRVDVSETPGEVTIKADLPGVEQKDIDISVCGDQLTIKAEKKSEAEEKKDEEGRIYQRVERSFGSFQRTMTLPFAIESGKVSASFKDGVLSVVVGKPPEVQKQTKKIEVKHAA